MDRNGHRETKFTGIPCIRLHGFCLFGSRCIPIDRCVWLNSYLFFSIIYNSHGSSALGLKRVTTTCSRRSHGGIARGLKTGAFEMKLQGNDIPTLSICLNVSLALFPSSVFKTNPRNVNCSAARMLVAVNVADRRGFENARH